MTENTLFKLGRQQECIALSSNFSIYPLFSRGCLFPPSLELGDEYAFPAPHGTNFVIFENAVTEAAVAAFETVARNLVPIGIVLRTGAALDNDNQMIECITLDQVERLVFRNEKELKRFKVSPFADVDLMSIDVEMVADAAAFAMEASQTFSPPNAKDEVTDSSTKRVRISDAYAGFCCSLLSSIPGKRSWFEMIASLLAAENSPRDNQEFNHISTIANVCLGGTVGPATSWEDKVLGTAASELLAMNPKEGWAAKELLSRITDISAAGMSAAERAEGLGKLRSWSEGTKRVLDDEATLPSLGDEGSLVLRALLLLLVRGNTESLLALRNRQREERVGTKVWRLSFVLAALHEGLRSLPKEVKYGGNLEVSRARMEVLGASARLCKARLDQTSSVVRPPSLTVQEDDRDGQQTINLSFKSIVIASSIFEVNPALRKAAGDCQYYGFEVGPIAGEFFEVASGADQFLRKGVKVSVWLDQNNGREVLRFRSISKPLSSGKTRSKKDPLAFISGKLSKADLLTMLFSNADVSQNCRVAIETEPAAVVVVVDQMLDTMDRDECIAHLKNVSNKAADLAEQLT